MQLFSILKWDQPETYILLIILLLVLGHYIKNILKSPLIQKIKIKIFKSEFEINKKEEVLPEINSVDSNKIAFDLNDISLIIYKTSQITTQQNEMIRQTLQRQMDFAEQTLITMVHQLLYTYQDLQKHVSEDIPKSVIRKDYFHFQSILYNYIQELLLVFRQAFLLNGFYNIDGQPLLNYINEKSAYIQARSSRFFTSAYPEEMSVLDNKIQDMIYNDVDYKLYVTDIVNKAKEIHFEQQQLIKQLDFELQEYIEEIKKNA